MYQILSQSVRCCRLYIKKHFDVIFRFTLYSTPPVTAKQRVAIIPGDQAEEEIDGCGGKLEKTSRKGKF